MKTLDQIIQELDEFTNNSDRREHLKCIKNNPDLPRHDIRRLACNILIESDFVGSNYKITFVEIVKKRVAKIKMFFIKFLEFNKMCK